MGAPLPQLQSRPPRGLETNRLPQQTILCFSHLRWDFVHQRPQHLLNEAARTYRVYFVEEPEFQPGISHFRMRVAASGVTILTPVIAEGSDQTHELRSMVAGLQRSVGSSPIIHWYYTPMALRFTSGLSCDLCVYDCMDELSAFRFAPPDLGELETEILRRADLVFTGGQSLFLAKRQLHADTHCFPSSVDVAHFRRARLPIDDPPDQTDIPEPRIGYAGVIDERIDQDLIATAARTLPSVQFVMIGPVVKIDPQELPRAANIHWLGRKHYDELPDYMANWGAAWMPFALNDATRYISPTKTPEYLAAGLRVTATGVADVVQSYGRQGLVTIADAGSITAALQASLEAPPPAWLSAVDRCLAQMSWAGTWSAMRGLMDARLRTSLEIYACSTG